MHTFPLALLAMVPLAAPAGAATRNFGITSFEKIRVDGPYSVKLTTGVAPFASASGSPAALDRVAIEMLGTTLVVHANSSAWGDPDGNAGPVEISLGTHDLSQAWLNGSGSLAIDKVKGLTFGLTVQGSGLGQIGQADVDQLTVNLIGTASGRLAGRAGTVTAIVRGISSLDAANLAVKDATLGAEGAATIGANVSNSATVNATGPATVRFTGGPSCTLKVRGSATVDGCR